MWYDVGNTILPCFSMTNHAKRALVHVEARVRPLHRDCKLMPIRGLR